MKFTMLVIRPLNVTPHAEDTLSVAIPVGADIIKMMEEAREIGERLDYGAHLSNGNPAPDVGFNVVEILDTLAWALAHISLPQVMGVSDSANLMRDAQREHFEMAHKLVYAFLKLQGHAFFCQDDQNEWLQIGHWAQTKPEASQFPQRTKWEAALIAYERIRALQNETKVSLAKDEHEEYEPSPYDGTYGEE